MSNEKEFYECENCRRRDTTDIVDQPSDSETIAWHCHECGHTTIRSKDESTPS